MLYIYRPKGFSGGGRSSLIAIVETGPKSLPQIRCLRMYGISQLGIWPWCILGLEMYYLGIFNNEALFFKGTDISNTIIAVNYSFYLVSWLVEGKDF